MFAKRRLARRKRPRFPLKRRVVRKRQILRPQFLNAVEEKPTFDASGSSLYLWMYINPEVSVAKQEAECKASVSSLRQICANVVAANPESICTSYLQDASWTCWKLVWESALRQGMDLPSLFRIFAENFGTEPSFRCHTEVEGIIERLHDSTADLKRSALLACLVPTHAKHRMDNVFSNISISDFVTFVSSTANCSAVVDCSKMPLLTTANLLTLCKIPNLGAIDVSYNRLVDDQFLYTLNTCLVSQTSKLNLLRVCGCPGVTTKGISALIEANENSLLVFIETDIYLTSLSMFSSKFLHVPDLQQDAPIPGTRWRSVKDEHSALGLLGRHSLATKVNFLLRTTELFKSAAVIWDIKFFNQVAEQSTSIRTFNETVWRLRLQLATTRKMTSPYLYIKDANTVVPRIVKEEVKLDKTTEAAIPVPKPSVRKPKHVKTDANTFFFGF